MGIPAFFSQFILRRHKNVLRKFARESASNLCLDSNSIVYDAVRALPPDTADFEAALIRAVCAKIDSYIAAVQPRRVFVAFDGIPPKAKMKQQRERRYKASAALKAATTPKAATAWDTVQITPGTHFMTALNRGLTKHFEGHPAHFEFFRLSTSAEPGEGEHKLFEWLRTARPDGHTFVYGLDSDLIILALHHLKYTPIHLLREDGRDGELRLLDVAALHTQIEQSFGRGKVPDYIFVTFFLGNDFMPHFPALNLRTRGLDTLLKTYKSVVRPDERLYDGEDTIFWKVVHRYVQALAARETGEISREYADRGKEAVDPDDPENLPRLHREVEHYIAPGTTSWEDRYYATCLKVEPHNAHLVCADFYAMLEWNTRYYTRGCPDWKLYYPHTYPPLLRDLAKVEYSGSTPGTSTQPTEMPDFLSYVLPSTAARYADVTIAPQTPIEQWAFCTFRWESHLLF
jgi:5'-3' exoribonuclease 1